MSFKVCQGRPEGTTEGFLGSCQPKLQASGGVAVHPRRQVSWHPTSVTREETERKREHRKREREREDRKLMSELERQ